jgi:chloramphenicol-sensitive protein RarD
MLAPLALGTEPRGGALVAGPALSRTLLLCAGPITALPLVWFGSAARRLPLSTLGLFQYLAPTLALLLAVFLYGEAFTRAHGIAFALIWGALGLYTVDALRRAGAARRPRGAESPARVPLLEE